MFLRFEHVVFVYIIDNRQLLLQQATQSKCVPLNYNCANILVHRMFFMYRLMHGKHKKIRKILKIGPCHLFKKWTVVPPIYWSSDTVVPVNKKIFKRRRAPNNSPRVAYCQRNCLLIFVELRRNGNKICPGKRPRIATDPDYRNT
jgi:hypothetical protein